MLFRVKSVQFFDTFGGLFYFTRESLIFPHAMPDPPPSQGGMGWVSSYSLYSASTGFSLAAFHERASTMALVTASTMSGARANTHQ